MHRGTTPTLTFGLPFEGTKITKACLAFAQGGEVVLEKALDDLQVEGTTLKVKLTERETLELRHEMVLEIQLRCVVDGNSLASNIVHTTVERILKDGVL